MSAQGVSDQSFAQGNTLVDVLVSQGIIKTDQAQSIKLQELQTSKNQEELLISSGLVTEEQLARSKSALYSVPFVDLEQTPISPEALAILPQAVASRFLVIPIEINKEKKQLSLAMADPLDISAIGFVEQKTGLGVRPLTALPSQVQKLIAERYSVGLAQEVTQA